MALEILDMQSINWVTRVGPCSLWRVQLRTSETVFLVQVSRLSSWPTWLCSFPPDSVRLTRERKGQPVLIFSARDDDSARRFLCDASQARKQIKSQLRFFVGHGFADR